MSGDLAKDLNRDCHCISVDRNALQEAFSLVLSAASPGPVALHIPDTLFAGSPVFLSERHFHAMTEVIHAIEALTLDAGYQEAVLAPLPDQAHTDHGPRGVFTSYDFHLDEDGPRLIEINTNAGGVLLNHYLATAQRACCMEVADMMARHPTPAVSEADFVAMFRQEWHRQRRSAPLNTVAIVDLDPHGQFLYPEFLLYQSLFGRHGIEALIADPAALRIRQGRLWIGDKPVDMVYNRLTDFYLSLPESATLLQAYRDDLAVVTPSPHVYGLWADKRNLPLLSDPDQLRALGINESIVDVLARYVPETVRVTCDKAEVLWAGRKRYFFKPVTGYGSRGAFRGDKLTRRVWADILSSDYIAQQLVTPTERDVVTDGERRSLKVDFRCVAYGGRMQQVSARLYQGQTTNLRTQGGGLATVLVAPDQH